MTRKNNSHMLAKSMSQTLSGAERIKRLRHHLNFSQRELADEFNVTHGAIGLWESGERPVQGPGLRLLEMFENELGLRKPTDSNLKEIDQIITSRFSRNLSMAQIASKAFSMWGGHLIRSKFSSPEDLSELKQKAYLNLVKEVIATLSEMKGLPMKLGQIISYHDISMPENVRMLFEELQTNSYKLSRKVVTQVIRDELGAAPKQIFAKWSSEPFAAASIGQVHFARLHTGEDVAVKIQYPGIAKTIRSDLQNIELFTKLMKLIVGPTNAQEIVGELAVRLKDECDYLKEAESQDFFRGFFSGRDEIIIPKVHSEFSRRSILCSEWIDGQSFMEFLSKATQEDRNRVGEILWQFYFESIFCARRMNADPHPGNYLIKGSSVVFLDFGCSSPYSAEFVKNWRSVLLYAMSGDENELLKTLEKMGMFPDSRVDREQLQEIVKAIYAPYLHDGPFVFTHEYVKNAFRTWFLSSRSRQNFIFRSEWIFLTRILFGLSSVLAMLGTQANWRRKMLHLLNSERASPNYEFQQQTTPFLPKGNL